MYCATLTKVGGGRETLIEDLEQAAKMGFLRNKIDVLTEGRSEAYRNYVRDHLRDLYCTLPIRRLWLYLKSQRDTALQSAETYENMLGTDHFGFGPEDVIVKVKHIVRPECLGLLMYFTVLLDIQHRKHPELNPSSDFELNAEGAKRLQTIRFLTFTPG
jgi:hypothetical protein